jgi:hypothetical protein
MNILKNKQGETKYYATYYSAWKAAAKLNETELDNLWWFEADLNGWFLFQDGETK